jgi:hypothetical protein
MTNEEKKAFWQTVETYMGSEEGVRYICGEQFDRDWAAFKARLEREMFTVADAAAMFNNLPVDVFRFIYGVQLGLKAEELRLTDAVPPTSAVN